MPDFYHHVSSPEAEFVDYNIGGYDVRVPSFYTRAPRSSWETPRFNHMEKHLRPGMTLFDIGAENGSMSAIYSRFVGGGENMVLFEPVPVMWPNIKATWEANGVAKPRATYCGFVNDRSWVSDYHAHPLGTRDGWPECAYDDKLLDATKFMYPSEHGHLNDSTTIDEFVVNTGTKPDALTMDVEGYEPSVIAGAVVTIRAYRPMIWVSIHDPAFNGNNILLKYTGSDRINEMNQTLLDAGYGIEHIHTDHERHTFYNPRP